MISSLPTIDAGVTPSKPNKVRREGYKEWLLKNGVDADAAYGTALSRAELLRLTAAPTYGAMAEKLAGGRQERSGYAEYLRGVAEGGYKKNLRAAEDTFDSIAKENSEGYKSYAEAFDKNQSKIYTSVVNALERGSIKDYYDALDYAKAAGLTDELAERAAKSGSEARITRLKNEAIEAVYAYGLDNLEAYEYAKKLGIDEDGAKDISNYAWKIRDRRINQ